MNIEDNGMESLENDININDIDDLDFDSQTQDDKEVENEKVVIANQESISEKDKKLIAEYNRIKDLSTRVSILETVNNAFWKILLTMGASNEDLNKMITLALEETENAKYMKCFVICDSCGRKLQKSGPLKNKCIYCGHNTIGNPYDSVLEKEDEDISTSTATMVSENKPEAVVEVIEDDYDIEQDLNFEE